LAAHRGVPGGIAFAVGDGMVDGDAVTRSGAVTIGISLGRVVTMDGGVVAVGEDTPTCVVQSVSTRRATAIIVQRTRANLGQTGAIYGSKQRQVTSVVDEPRSARLDHVSDAESAI
jgi:hypothetical protein